MFEITGIVDGEKAYCKYEKGKLTGDQFVINRAIEENEKDHGWIGLIPTTINKDYIKSESPCYSLLLNYVFEKGAKSTKDWYDKPTGSDEFVRF